MKEKEIRSLLHHADEDIAMQIAERWPYPDKWTHTAGSSTEHNVAESVSEVAVTVQHPPVWRYAATFAAVLLLIGGSIGGIMLMQSMRRSEPVPSAEEQCLASSEEQSDASSGSEPDTMPLPVIVPGKDEEPVESVEATAEININAETMPFSQEKTEPNTDAAGSSDVSAASLETDATASVKETTAPTEAVTEAPTGPAKTAERITLAEAVRICSESGEAWRACETIRDRYEPDAHDGSGIDYQMFYLDDAGNEMITVSSNGGGEVYYRNRSMGDGERWLLASNRSGFADDFVKYRSTVYDLQWRETTQLLHWVDNELNKPDSALSDEQKAQLRSLAEEESSLWTTHYIRRRMEIIGALSPDAAHLTYDKAEKICSACETPEQAMEIILNSYVPGYDWGSGMTYYNYSLDAEGKATISLVVGSSVIYWENFADPGNRNMRDFFQ
ncbi:MAG: hypothetical protein K5695_15120 [Oscillospiraceae bacterium]|nr:hypothetical protein [Oscillospiraceae bacterium]